jgi:enoyl-CoA hydratase/carnithine racemase
MAGYSDLRYLQVQVASGVATVVMAPKDDDVDVYHSFFTELRDVFSSLSLDHEVSAAVLTGVGDVFFGGVGRNRTRRLVGAGIPAVADQFLSLRQIITAMLDFRKPLVAAVNGRAHNIGGQIALLSDFAVAGPAASFGDHHVQGGLAAGDGGTMLWPLLVGLPRAREVLLRGKEIRAAEALDLGLVAEIVAPEQVVPRAQALARELAQLPGLAYLSTKLALNGWWKLSNLISWDLALAFEAAGLVTPENVERLEGR